MKKLPKSPGETYRVESQYGPEIAVLNPLFPRKNKVEIDIGGSYQGVSSLNNYYSVHGAGTWHFNRRHAFEPIWFQYNWGDYTNFVESEIRDKLPPSVPPSDLAVELPKWIYAATYYFSPYYSKMHITESSVWHFDTYMGAGIAVVKTEEKYLNGARGEQYNRIGGNVALGMRFLFGSRWGFRMEIRDFIFKSKNIGAMDTQNLLQISAGLSVFFGGFPDYTSL
ncbi:outer membrane beta-barrel domain-containing protein [bacterium]|nr:outer membrane beta-barrel domain-containing protein [bacterium]